MYCMYICDIDAESVYVYLTLCACSGNRVQKYRIPRVRRLEDGEKGGIELRRRTRLFSEWPIT